MPTICRPFFSKRERISPQIPRWTASGLKMISVRSMYKAPVEWVERYSRRHSARQEYLRYYRRRRRTMASEPIAKLATHAGSGTIFSEMFENAVVGVALSPKFAVCSVSVYVSGGKLKSEIRS